jgi:hypothetical protein
MCRENKRLFDHFLDQIISRMEGSDVRLYELYHTRFVNDENYCQQTNEKLKNICAMTDKFLENIENKKGVCWLHQGDIRCFDKQGHIVSMDREGKLKYHDEK